MIIMGDFQSVDVLPVDVHLVDALQVWDPTGGNGAYGWPPRGRFRDGGSGGGRGRDRECGTVSCRGSDIDTPIEIVNPRSLKTFIASLDHSTLNAER